MSGVAERTIEERIFNSGFDHRAELGDYSLEEAIARLRDALEYRGSAAALVEAWAEAFEPDLSILEYVASLAVRTAVFTNNGPMLEACLEGPLSELRDAFDEVICSWHIRVCKPDALAYQRAAARLGVSPGRLLLLGDSPENVDAALRCGWDAELVTDLGGLVIAVEGRLSTRDA